MEEEQVEGVVRGVGQNRSFVRTGCGCINRHPRPHQHHEVRELSSFTARVPKANPPGSLDPESNRVWLNEAAAKHHRTYVRCSKNAEHRAENPLRD